MLHQISLPSFADADGDGVGALRGAPEHLDHLQRLGIDGIWVSPVTVSPATAGQDDGEGSVRRTATAPSATTVKAWAVGSTGVVTTTVSVPAS